MERKFIAKKDEILVDFNKSSAWPPEETCQNNVHLAILCD